MVEPCKRGRCIGFAGARGSCPHGHDTIMKTETRRDPETGGEEEWTLEYSPPCCGVYEAGIIADGPPASPTNGHGHCLPGALLREYVCSERSPLQDRHTDSRPEERRMCCHPMEMDLSDGEGGVIRATVACTNTRPCPTHEPTAAAIESVNGAAQKVVEELFCAKCGARRATMSQHGGGTILRWPCACGGDLTHRFISEES